MATTTSIVSLNQLVKWFESFADRHYFLKDFGFGEPYDIGTTRQMEFPYMWLTLDDTSIIATGTNVKSAIPDYSFRVFFMDKINIQENYLDQNGFQSDNSQQILSDTIQYLQDLITEIQQDWAQYGVMLSADVNFNPVIDETQDKSTGVSASITLRTRQVNCVIPVSPTNIVVQPSQQTYETLLTCETLDECSTFQTYAFTGGTYNSGTTALTLTSINNNQIVITGITGGGGGSGTSGTSGLGLSAKTGKVSSSDSGWYTDGSRYYYNIVFTQPFATTAYTQSVYQTSPSNPTIFTSGQIQNVAPSGFTVSFSSLSFFTGLTFNWSAIAHGETGVAGTSGTSGSSGITPATTKYYGSFYDTTLQGNSGATSANTMTFNTTDFASGVSIVDNSKITFANTGKYDIQFSAQFDKTDSGTDDVEVWLSKNGNNVDWSSTSLSLTGNNAKLVAAWNFFVDASAGDYYQLKWHSNDLDMRILARAGQSNPSRPEIPSIILTVNQVN